MNKTAQFNSLTSAFTIIELLIVVAIIAILTTIVILVPVSATKKGRDVRRDSDIKQYQSALEVFASKNSAGLYPSRTGGTGVSAASTLCGDLTLTNCPEDPTNASDSTYSYKYQSNGSSLGTIDATKYILWAKLEATSGFFLVCSTGKTGVMAATWTPSGGGGNCPL